MQEDKTVIIPLAASDDIEPEQTVLLAISAGLTVSLVDPDGRNIKDYFFSAGFTAGRSPENDIVVQHGDVSRCHLEIKKENNQWWLYDLNSTNGIYIQDSLISGKTQLHFPVSMFFGSTGISLKIDIFKPEAEKVNQESFEYTRLISAGDLHEAGITRHNLSKEEIKARLLAKNESENAGDYTKMVRNIILEDRTSRGKKYHKVISFLGVFVLIASALAIYQYLALSKARNLAIDMFYDMKALEVSLARSEITLEKSSEVLEQTLNALAKEKHWTEQDLIRVEQEKIRLERERVAQEKQRLISMNTKYQEYVKEATVFRFRFPTNAAYEEQLITKVARELGESELEVPERFVDEVRKYIKYWQGSPRMPQAMARLEKNNYAPDIIAALKREGLPYQFLYLPLQESNFNTLAVGPPTRFGIAKGAWQFIPSTAQQYGLSPGPLADTREFDDLDGRFDFRKATVAGAKYIKFMFSTEAQASSLLVMAGYNYGDGRVRGMIKRMPDNPRDKNFWKFIQQYTIPKETYDYVFYIFSAAVIGEDPKHFGFNFRSPTAYLGEE